MPVKTPPAPPTEKPGPHTGIFPRPCPVGFLAKPFPTGSLWDGELCPEPGCPSPRDQEVALPPNEGSCGTMAPPGDMAQVGEVPTGSVSLPIGDHTIPGGPSPLALGYTVDLTGVPVNGRMIRAPACYVSGGGASIRGYLARVRAGPP